MLKKKLLREKGKIRLSEYFKKLEVGNRVAVKREPSLMPKFPKSIQGRVGIIEGKRGSHYLIKINDLNKEKIYLIHPIHLKKLITIKK